MPISASADAGISFRMNQCVKQHYCTPNLALNCKKHVFFFFFKEGGGGISHENQPRNRVSSLLPKEIKGFQGEGKNSRLSRTCTNPVNSVGHAQHGFKAFQQMKCLASLHKQVLTFNDTSLKQHGQWFLWQCLLWSHLLPHMCNFIFAKSCIMMNGDKLQPHLPASVHDHSQRSCGCCSPYLTSCGWYSHGVRNFWYIVHIKTSLVLLTVLLLLNFLAEFCVYFVFSVFCFTDNYKECSKHLQYYLDCWNITASTSQNSDLTKV